MSAEMVPTAWPLLYICCIFLRMPAAAAVARQAVDQWARWSTYGGVWPPSDPKRQLLVRSYESVFWFHASLQELGNDDVEVHSQAKFYDELESDDPFNKQLPYGLSSCGNGIMHQARNLSRIYMRYRQWQQLIYQGPLAALWNKTKAGTSGDELIQQAVIKLREAPKVALRETRIAAAFDEQACRDGAASFSAFARNFQVEAIGALLHLTAGLCCSSWAASLPKRATYLDRHELKVSHTPARSEVLVYLFKSLLDEGAENASQPQPCLQGIEIGTAAYETAEWVLTEIPCLSLISVDLRPFPGAWVKQSAFADRSELWEMSSGEAAAKHSGLVDLAFVDADHSYEAASSDIKYWLPKVRPGGILAGHDYTSVFPGVVQAVHELVAAQDADLHLGPDWMWWVHIPTSKRSVRSDL